MSILNLNAHPYDTASILDWVLEQWQANPGLDLLILTQLGEGEKLEMRIRIKLAKIRKSLKNQKITDIEQFGFRSSVFRWDVDEANAYDALALERIHQDRHVWAEAFETAGLKDFT